MSQISENVIEHQQQLEKDIEVCEQMRQDSIKSQDFRCISFIVDHI